MVEVGEYIRTNSGTIHKVVEVFNHGEFQKGVEAYAVDNRGGCITEKRVEKHSDNIFLILCVGDYIDGNEIIKIEQDNNILNISLRNEDVLKIDFDDNKVNLPVIKSILTKEAFRSAEYRIRS